MSSIIGWHLRIYLLSWWGMDRRDHWRVSLLLQCNTEYINASQSTIHNGSEIWDFVTWGIGVSRPKDDYLHTRRPETCTTTTRTFIKKLLGKVARPFTLQGPAKKMKHGCTRSLSKSQSYWQFSLDHSLRRHLLSFTVTMLHWTADMPSMPLKTWLGKNETNARIYIILTSWSTQKAASLKLSTQMWA